MAVRAREAHTARPSARNATMALAEHSSLEMLPPIEYELRHANIIA
jgi:hypothetical protein